MNMDGEEQVEASPGGHPESPEVHMDGDALQDYGSNPASVTRRVDEMDMGGEMGGNGASPGGAMAVGGDMEAQENQ